MHEYRALPVVFEVGSSMRNVIDLSTKVAQYTSAMIGMANAWESEIGCPGQSLRGFHTTPLDGIFDAVDVESATSDFRKMDDFELEVNNDNGDYGRNHAPQAVSFFCNFLSVLHDAHPVQCYFSASHSDKPLDHKIAIENLESITMKDQVQKLQDLVIQHLHKNEPNTDSNRLLLKYYFQSSVLLHLCFSVSMKSYGNEAKKSPDSGTVVLRMDVSVHDKSKWQMYNNWGKNKETSPAPPAAAAAAAAAAP